MSMPTFPNGPPIKIEEAVSMIMASIAMEELGFSHIINAEGEKLQYVLKTLPNNYGDRASVQELLDINNSIKNLLESILQNQMLLKGKLDSAATILRENREQKPKPPHPPVPPCPPVPPYPPVPPCPPVPPKPPCPPVPPKPPCPPVPPKPPCPPVDTCCRTVAYPGQQSQNWIVGRPMKWKHTKCHEHRDMYLTDNGERILLKHGKCYTVNFAADICPQCRPNVDSRISISIQLSDPSGKDDIFVYHAPAARTDSPLTVTVSGIIVSTMDFYEGKKGFDGIFEPELSIVLLSPDKVYVNKSTISITEM